MSKRIPIQFTASTLLNLTTLTALVIVYLPIACQVYVEMLCLVALILCVQAFIGDTVPKFSNSFVRTLISGSLAITAVGIMVHVLRGKTDAVPAVPIVLAISLAIFPLKPWETGRYRITLSAVGLLALVAIVSWQFYQTSSERYFVNRYLSGRYDLTNNDRDSIATFALRSDLRGRNPQPPLEIDTLWDMLDLYSVSRPITKWRFVCGGDAIDSLSFTNGTTPLDWKHLRNLPRLMHLDFSNAKVSGDDARSLRSLGDLSQLAFFECDLPGGFLKHCVYTKRLNILQIVDCKPVDLAGVAALSELRILNLQKSPLSSADLQQISMLHFLTQLNIQDTNLSTEGFIEFADNLKANATQRRGRFVCAVTHHPGDTAGLAALIRSGAVSEIVIARCTLPHAELANLKAIDPTVTVTKQLESP